MVHRLWGRYGEVIPLQCAHNDGIVWEPVNLWVRRVGAGALLLGVLLIGGIVAGRMSRDVRARVGALAANRVPLEDALAEKDQRAWRSHYDDAKFRADAAKSARAFELPAEAVSALHEAQRHEPIRIDAPITLAPGRSWSGGSLRIRASHEKVRYRRHGAMVAAKHLVATVQNIGPAPIAYRVVLRSNDRGHCEVRGARMHNALALMPEEKAEIVVCAGGGRLRVLDAETLSISPLGYYLLSQVPPAALDLDGIAASAHTPDRRVQRCTAVDVRGIAGWLRDGKTRWVDVVDFFSRHDCERFRFFLDYHHESGRRTLPVVPEAMRADG